jgi:hypothetical protein
MGLLGVRLHLRHVRSLDDLDDVTASGPVLPGDIVASSEAVYRVELTMSTYA